MKYVVDKQATINNVETIFCDLNECLNQQDTSLTIDMSGVEDIDFSFIQLLKYIGNKAKKAGHTLNIEEEIRADVDDKLRRMHLLLGTRNSHEALTALVESRG